MWYLNHYPCLNLFYTKDRNSNDTSPPLFVFSHGSDVSSNSKVVDIQKKLLFICTADTLIILLASIITTGRENYCTLTVHI